MVNYRNDELSSFYGEGFIYILDAVSKRLNSARSLENGRMLTIPTFLLILVAFWTILYVLGRIFHLEKYGLEVGPAYFIYKSGKMKAAVEALAQRWSRLWRTLCNVSLVIAIGLVIYSVYLFVSNILRFFFLGEVATRVSLIIPGITIRLYWIPYFMIAGAVIVVTHEVAHGIAAKLEKIPIESAGVMLALVFTGAFVEQNEKKFEEARTLSKLRMVAVGSATNLVTGLLVFLLWSALFTPAGIMILETKSGGPLASAGLGQWDSIYAVNGTRILNDLELYNYMTDNNVSAGDTLILDTNKGTIPINVTEGKWTKALGLTYYWNYFRCRLELGYFPAIYLHLALTWILLLAFAVAIFNMLPAYPFDGDKIVYYILERVMKKGLREARILITAVCFGLMATSIALSFMQHGLFFL